ncbi:MAG: hypothetical protein ABIQ57_14575 [Candidatus Kapaibacterium sp.]
MMSYATVLMRLEAIPWPSWTHGAAWSYPDHLCSSYAPQRAANRVVTYTQLVIGGRTFRLAYRQRDEGGTSPTAWASNRGVYGVEIIDELSAVYPPHWFTPLIWSIDYTICHIPGSELTVPMAFDLNTGPLLRGTGISDILSAEAVAGGVLDSRLCC